MSMSAYSMQWMRRLTFMIVCAVAPVWTVEAAPRASTIPDAQVVTDRVEMKMPAKKASSMSFAALSGEAVIREALSRHDFYPYIYEEQTLVLVDASKQRDVRRIRRYSRMEKDGTFKLLLEFVYPESVAGTALLFRHHRGDQDSSRIFLPGLGARLINYTGGMAGGQMLGSEFSVEDLMPEDIAAFIYQREPDMVDDNIPYFRVQAVPQTNSLANHVGFAKRLLFIRQDNFFVSRIDYFDSKGRLLKRQTYHDIHRIGGNMWRADLISVENMLSHYRSILKIEKRVYSRGYVPEEIFDEDRILAAAYRQVQTQIIDFGSAAADTQADDVRPEKSNDIGNVK